MNLPFVSIIIPYYNRPNKLERSLNSIASQSFTNYEIIVVDDCSSIPFQVKHNHITYLKNNSNSGPGVSRNLGMEKAKGTYIVFLDSDDYWHPEFLTTLVPILVNNPEACMAYSNGVNVDENCNVIRSRRKRTIYPTTILPNVLYNGRRWGTGSCLWRASIIKQVQYLEYRSWEDYAFDASVGIINNVVIPVKENLVFYDATGSDKLSNNNKAHIVKEKHKSILAISELLLKHDYKNDPVVNKSITILLILNTIAMIKLGIKHKDFKMSNLKHVRKWRNIRFYAYMLFMMQLSKRVGVKYLKKLKRKVNQDQLYFLK